MEQGRQPLMREMVEARWRWATVAERLLLVQQLVARYEAEPLPLYWVLTLATSEERREVVLALITQYKRVELPDREGEQAVLSDIDLSRETLGPRREQSPEAVAPWWSAAREGVNLMEANLQGADLARANLQGADLGWANLQGAVLEQANLQRAFLMWANLQGAVLMGAALQRAVLMWTNLQGAVLERANFQGAALWGTNLQGAHLKGADLRGTNLREANLQGANLQYARLEGVDLTECKSRAHLHVNGVYWERTRLRWEQLAGMIGEEEVARESREAPKDRAKLYADAKYGYLGLKQNFEELGDYDAASQAYRREREMERAEAWWRALAALHLAQGKRQWRTAAGQFVKWVSDSVQGALTGYGESVGRVLLAIGLVFAGFGVGFALTGSVVRDDGQAPTLWDYGLFSLLGMTTQDAAHLRPADPLVEAFTGLEALLAIALTGLLGFVLGNRIRHS